MGPKNNYINYSEGNFQPKVLKMGKKVDYNGFYEIKKYFPIFVNFGANIAPQSGKNSDFGIFFAEKT